MKKIVCLLLALCVMAFPVQTSASAMKLTSKGAVLVEASTGSVLMEHNAKEHLPIASITKIMTMLLIFEAMEAGAYSGEDRVTVSPKAQSMGGSQVYLDAGYSYSVNDLLKAIAVASANDACVAMAEFTSGTEGAFVEQMNARARQLGMDDTCFANCSGLPDASAYSCAADVAVMACELLHHEAFFAYSTIWIDEIPHEKDGRVTQISNTNKMIRWYTGADGVKTGSTSEAGCCLAMTAKRGEDRYIAVVLGAASSAVRFSEAQLLMDHAFASYTTVDPVESLKNIPIAVEGGKQTQVLAEPLHACRQVLKKGESVEFETVIRCDEVPRAPIAKGDTVGYADIVANGEVIASVPLTATEEVQRAGFGDHLLRLLRMWMQSQG